MKPNEVQITVQLNLEQVNTILNALGRMPYNEVDRLIADIRGAALQALKAAEEQAVHPVVSAN